MRRLSFLIIFIASLSLQALPTDPVVEEEITHLLQFIGSSACTYIRNNSEYTAQEALEHVQRKYHHYRKEINTAEDFIELSASHSALTGKSYLVKCNDQDAVETKNFLLAELKLFRQSNNR